MIKILEGTHAAAYGAKLCRPEVISAYPISPQTSIIEKLCVFVDKGELDASFIKVESEHSALAVCIAAQGAGVRTFTATSSQGLALMHELVHWAGGGRLPIVMVNVNRALGAPWCIKADQQDSMSQRDTGWLQFYCENNQEVLDTVILAYRISEMVQLPSMVCMDAFLTSHVSEAVDIPDQEDVDAFLPKYEPEVFLDLDNPYNIWQSAVEQFLQYKYIQHKAMEQAEEILEDVESEFKDIFGRSYGAVKEYRCEDAKIILVAMGSMSGTARHMVDQCRERGEKVGVLGIRRFRPFPTAEIRGTLSGRKRVVVVDRNISFGQGGVGALEVRNSLYGMPDAPPVFGFVAGLGGADVTPEHLAEALENVSTKEYDMRPQWIGVK
ncbi:MAG: pyruvate ferredoxin oxidoreductase [Deltaproteobacteria bacterium]|nr:pyruvate ferredoxin oxidoreductase [Deltaproteobacteria bacterium]